MFSGVDKLDVQDVLKVSLEKLNQKYTPIHYSLSHLVNGYRRFDPGRGMEYILDLSLKTRGGNKAGEVVKRVQLLRPLSQVGYGHNRGCCFFGILLRFKQILVNAFHPNFISLVQVGPGPIQP